MPGNLETGQTEDESGFINIFFILLFFRLYHSTIKEAHHTCTTYNEEQSDNKKYNKQFHIAYKLSEKRNASKLLRASLKASSDLQGAK